MRKTTPNDYSIIALERFIRATRDSGYKGTKSAIAEIVDNAIQAGADEITINIRQSTSTPKYPIEIEVVDNGCGMDPFTLRQALRFGGSTRFNDRAGLGRYGMGLPNSSLSQARKVTVFTWREPDEVYWSFLDVDEIAAGKMKRVPAPRVRKTKPIDDQSASGTLVSWTRCDRLDNRRISTIVRKLAAALGRQFRYFIGDNIQVVINGAQIKPIDPLYLDRDAVFSGASIFGTPQEYEVYADPTDPASETGVVTVTFSELPVHEWHGLPNREKRRLGISKGSGVSVVRAGREVDYGWFFLGGKRRENYDDWWRCEVRFEPVLDEAFGITHTKQQVRPKPFLIEALSDDIATTARALNRRARRAHLEAKSAQHFKDAERLADERGRLLPPIIREVTDEEADLHRRLEKKHPTLKNRDADASENGSYRIIETSLKEQSFFSYAFNGEQVVLVINPDHPFYKQVYRPLVESDRPEAKSLRTQLELILLAAARSEATLHSPDEATRISSHRKAWSDALATFLNG